MTRNPLYLFSAIFMHIIICMPVAFGQIQSSRTYLNVTRNGVGGPIATGDTLEIRAVISVPSGTTVTNLSYTDAVPAGTTYVPGSIKAITNEGLVLATIPATGNYTDLAGDDKGQIVGSAITINMGTGATAAAGGSLVGGTTTPVFYNSQSILMAAYRVRVTALIGSTITLAGVLNYKVGAASITINFPARQLSVLIPNNCTIPGANLLTDEVNGTFGSGTTQNRSSSPNVSGFGFQNLTTGQPADGNYSIVKNTSPTQYTGAAPAGTDRVFGVWDIIGDHTGSATGVGNPPAASGVNAGYMLAVNGTYAPASLFATTVTGLKAFTDYSFSFWLYNICPKCGADPTKNASSGTPGVKPNLAFQVNGVDYFTTGEITYSGAWINKGFAFNSGPSTSLTFTILNNAPGGGGNDWVIDDIKLGACTLTILQDQSVNLKGSLQNDGAELTWRTLSGDNMQFFEIERSIDGSQFDQAGMVESYSGSDGAQFHFTDHPGVFASKLYYRLHMITENGLSLYSNIIALDVNNNQQLEISLAPNPTKGSSTLHIKAAQNGLAQIIVYDISSRKIWSTTSQLFKGYNSIPILPVGNLIPGVYFVKTIIGDQSNCSKLLIE
jgi:uncharacterized repeat protein (TIGR01451 family)